MDFDENISSYQNLSILNRLKFLHYLCNYHVNHLNPDNCNSGSV